MKLAVLAVLAVAGSAQAGVAWDYLYRGASASVPVDDMVSSIEGLGDWSGWAHVSLTDSYHDPRYPSFGDANLYTSTDGPSIYFAGDVAGYDGMPVGGSGSGNGSAVIRGVFTVTDTPQLVQVVMHGMPTMDHLYQYGLDIYSSLTGARVYGGQELDGQITLNPGTYRVVVYAGAGSSGTGTGGASGTFTGRLILPTPWSMAVLGGLLVGRRRR